MYAIFLKHPHSVGETYFEHMVVALRFAFVLLAAGIACAIHAAIPVLFERTASRCIASLYTRMVSHRRRQPANTEIDYAI